MTVEGRWTSNCDSTHRPGKYARFYSFKLRPPTLDVSIDLTSRDQDTYLFLLSGSGESGSELAHNDDFGGTLDSRIERELSAGTYTVEATTYYTRRSGSFTLTIQVSPALTPTPTYTPTPTRTAIPTPTPTRTLTPTPIPTPTPTQVFVIAWLSPDPSTVNFHADGAWHHFTLNVNPDRTVKIVANPTGSDPRVEITSSSYSSNYCSNGAEQNDDRDLENGDDVYFAGCLSGTGTVELRDDSTDVLLTTYTFTIGNVPTPTPTAVSTPTAMPTPTPTPVSDRKYAWANLYSGSYDGVKGSISTAIPGVRDGPSGFSSEVIWMTPATTPGTVEVGWRTMEPPYQNPRWYTGYYDNSGTWQMTWEGSPTVGVSYEYKIEKNASGAWDISIDGYLIRTRNTIMTVGSVVQAGGEVTKYDPAVDNAMGISIIRNMRYKRPSSDVWFTWSGWDNTHVDTSNGYTLAQIGASHDDFLNYGNNP